MNSNDWHPLTESLRVSRDIVHVLRLTLDAGDERIEWLRRLLSPDELARADRYKVPLPRRHFIVCRAVLRQLLAMGVNCTPTEIDFEYGPHGKPLLRQSSTLPEQLQFSVSHSANQALIAVSQGRLIGVDIERIDPSVRILKLAQRFFSSREATELNQLKEADQLAGFFQGWTSKEAYLKATGFGLSFPLNKFSVSLDPHQQVRLIEVVDQPAEVDRWRLLRLNPISDFAAALMFEAQTCEQVHLRQWTLDSGVEGLPGDGHAISAVIR